MTPENTNPRAELEERLPGAVNIPMGQLHSRPLRTVPAALAVLLFLGTLVALTTMPICHE